MRRDGVERFNGVVTTRVLPSYVGMMMIGQLRYLGTVHLPIGRVPRSQQHSVKWARCDGVNWVRREIVGSRFGGTVISMQACTGQFYGPRLDQSGLERYMGPESTRGGIGVGSYWATITRWLVSHPTDCIWSYWSH